MPVLLSGVKTCVSCFPTKYFTKLPVTSALKPNIAEVWKQSNRIRVCLGGFVCLLVCLFFVFNQKMCIYLVIVCFLSECQWVKMFYLTPWKNMETSHGCLTLATDIHIVLQDFRSVTFSVLQSGKNRLSFSGDRSGTFWTISIRTPKKLSATMLKWELLPSYVNCY